jgi:selenide,water dikinase
MGHLTEMCEGSDVSAEVIFDLVPTIDKTILNYYLDQKSIPGGTNRNYASYGHKIAGLDDYKKAILCDPQTSGGLLVAVQPDHVIDFTIFCKNHGLDVVAFGTLVEKQESLITVV